MNQIPATRRERALILFLLPHDVCIACFTDVVNVGRMIVIPDADFCFREIGIALTAFDDGSFLLTEKALVRLIY